MTTKKLYNLIKEKTPLNHKDWSSYIHNDLPNETLTNNVNKTINNTTLLHFACEFGNTRAVQILLLAGANSSSKIHPQNKTPGVVALESIMKLEIEENDGLNILELLYTDMAEMDIEKTLNEHKYIIDRQSFENLKKKLFFYL